MHSNHTHNTQPSVAPAPASSNSSRPPADLIAVKAYEIYQQYGRQDGHDLDHWLQAEASVRTQNRANG